MVVSATRQPSHGQETSGKRAAEPTCARSKCALNSKVKSVLATRSPQSWPQKALVSWFNEAMEARAQAGDPGSSPESLLTSPPSYHFSFPLLMSLALPLALGRKGFQACPWPDFTTASLAAIHHCYCVGSLVWCVVGRPDEGGSNWV